MFKEKGHVLVLLITGILLLAATSTALARGNVNAFIGTKSLDADYWAPVESQAAAGVEADFGADDSPLRFAVNLISSAATDNYSFMEVTGETLELQLGAKGFFGDGPVHPFVGGGLTIATGYFSGSYYTTVDDNDTALGLWLSGGVLFNTGHFNLGLELGYSKADIELFGIKGDAGGTRFGILIGGNW